MCVHTNHNGHAHGTCCMHMQHLHAWMTMNTHAYKTHKRTNAYVHVLMTIPKYQTCMYIFCFQMLYIFCIGGVCVGCVCVCVCVCMCMCMCVCMHVCLCVCAWVKERVCA